MATSPYEYLPLTFPEIRLATLHPGQFSDDIVVSLVNHEFSKSSKPVYEALSYAWGSTKHQQTIMIQEVGALKQLRVTENLGCALRYLRLAQQSRVLWIDAICIDQGNDREKSEQVGHMGDIYASAGQVLVWLGYPSWDSGLAIQKIKSFGASINIRSHSSITYGSGSEAESYHINPTNVRWTTSLRNFFQRPWFSRLWIRHEVKLATKALAILGYSEILWEDSYKIILLLRVISLTHFTIWNTSDLTRIRALIQKEYHSLYDLLVTSTNSNYYDPRDIVYANLSMSPEMKSLNIQPDYEKSPLAVYQDLFFKHIQKYKVLHMMLLCDIRQNLPKFPSFIPNLSIPKPRLCELPSFAAARIKQSQNFVESDRLKLEGIQVTTVSNVKNRAPFSSHAAEMLSAIRNWEPDDLMNAAYCCGGSLLDAYCSILICSYSFEKRTTSSSSAKELRNQFLDTVWSGSNFDPFNDLETREYVQRIINYMQGYAFFQTTTGHIGVSSAAVEPGDCIFILLGGEAPFILRPLAESSEFQVVGTCYLHGVMFGEAILGALRPWVCYRDMQSGVCQFTNEETGERNLEDPRLWPLPLEWELHYCNNAGFCTGECVQENEEHLIWGRFYNKITEEVTQDDPRLSADALKEHDITLEEIVLI